MMGWKGAGVEGAGGPGPEGGVEMVRGVERMRQMSRGDLRVEVTVRRWSVDSNAFMTDAVYELCLPRGVSPPASDNQAA
jgi:hypothetical protein